jgi:hypothetical protein
MGFWMSVRSISLRKLIKILFLPANRRVSGIRDDIRKDMNRSQDAAAGGSSFLRVLLFRNVSGPHVTGLDAPRMTNAVCARDLVGEWVKGKVTLRI